MNPNGKNTILITGGGSGIGRGLAEAFHALGNTVIIAGRRESALKSVVDANAGMSYEILDVQNAASLQGFAAKVTAKYPSLNVLVNMAGIMQVEDLVNSPDMSIIDGTIATNLTAPLHLTATLLPHLKQQAKSTVMNVSSGLAFTPLALTPTYSATKAAIHSWSISLRYQLRDTSVEVLELAPPYVQTELMGEHQASDPRAMPLADFVSETMNLLSTQPEATEILVKKVHPLRFAGNPDMEAFDSFVKNLNEAMSSH